MKIVSFRLLIISTLFLLSSCAFNRAPDGWLPDAESVPLRYNGAWAELSVASSANLYGEFIAATRDTVFILAKDSMVTLPLAAIVSARLVLWRSNSGRFASNTFFGTLSTIGHGIFLIITAPIWLLGGSTVAITESYAPVEYQYQPGSAWWQSMAKYARFPQGLPAGINHADILPYKAIKK